MGVMSEYYEPESLVAKLVVGARVRVRTSGECPGLPTHRCHDLDWGAEQGGIIVNITREKWNQRFPEERGHRFDVKLRAGGYGHYAAVELEPVEEV